MRWIPLRSVAVFLTFTMFTLGLNRAEAMLAPANNPAAATVRAQDMQTVQTFLEQKEVVQHLAGMNLTSDEIQSRLGNLSDQELHQVATKIHQQQPGRDGAGLLVTVLIIGVLVLLFVYLLKRV